MYGGMLRFMPNCESADIFNGVLEVPDPAQKAQNLAKNRMKKCGDPAFTIPALTMPRRPTRFGDY
jgi:hypothetical protein